VEHVLRAVRAHEAGVTSVVRPEHVVVGKQVVEPELLRRLRVLADAARIGADLGLREDDAELGKLCGRQTEV
jgi:hypothetical protein